MADLPSHTDTGDGPDLRSNTRRARWKTMTGIAVAIVAIVLLVVLHLTGVLGPGEH
jgi:hypothetical protein